MPESEQSRQPGPSSASTTVSTRGLATRSELSQGAVRGSVAPPWPGWPSGGSPCSERSEVGMSSGQAPPSTLDTDWRSTRCFRSRSASGLMTSSSTTNYRQQQPIEAGGQTGCVRERREWADGPHASRNRPLRRLDRSCRRETPRTLRAPASLPFFGRQPSPPPSPQPLPPPISARGWPNHLGSRIGAVGLLSTQVSDFPDLTLWIKPWLGTLPRPGHSV